MQGKPIAKDNVIAQVADTNAGLRGCQELPMSVIRPGDVGAQGAVALQPDCPAFLVIRTTRNWSCATLTASTRNLYRDPFFCLMKG